MNSLTWRVLIVGAVALALWAAYPEREDQPRPRSPWRHPSGPPGRGRDARAETDKDMERLRQEATEKGLIGLETERTGDSAFVLRGVEVEDEPVIAKAAADYLPGWDWRRVNADLRFEMTATRCATRGDGDQPVLQTIRQPDRRVRRRRAGDRPPGLDSNRIVVQLFGVDDPERSSA